MDVKVKMIFAQELQQQTNGNAVRNLVIEPVYVLRVPFIPAGIKFGLMVLTSGIDFTKDNEITIDIKNEDGDEIFSTGKHHLEKNFQNKFDNYIFSINVESAPVKKEGKLIATFNLNDDITYTEELEIVANENLLN